MYDTETNQLFVKFKSSNLDEYIYDNVPHQLFLEIQKSESVGKFLHENIKNKYNFKKKVLLMD